jgi:adenosylmethionine-8-amino-7-oxononanoate aminotransferase
MSSTPVSSPTERRVADTPRGGSVMSFYMKPGTPRPPLIDRGEGVYLIDRDGRRYLDATSGAVVCNIGHAHPRVVKTMQAQAARVTFAYPRFFESEDNVVLADMLCEMAGPGFERAFFVSGGSEANEAAMKLARQHAVATGQATRWKVIAREPSYHGSTLGALGVTGDAFTESLYAPMVRIAPKVRAPMSYRLPEGESFEDHAMACARELEERILAEGAETVLAFIMEPIGGLSSGAVVAPASYYQEVRRICTRYGVLLIHDEIMSGAGRSGAFLSSAHWPGATPDIVTLAKGLAAGYTPFGAVLASDAMVRAVAEHGGFVHGHTYFSNPFSCAVARAVVEVVRDERLTERAAEMGAYLAERLAGLAAQSPLVGDVRGKGLLMAIELVADKATRQSYPAALNVPAMLTEHGLRHGIALYNRRANRGVYGDMQLIAPPLVSTRGEIDALVEKLGAALRDLQTALQGMR